MSESVVTTPAATCRIIYCEQSDDPSVRGRLRAIADRAQGTVDDPLTARAIAEACSKACGDVGAAFWRAYTEEVEHPSEWPIRRCDICRADVVPVALGTTRVLCPICRPICVRVEALERQYQRNARRVKHLCRDFQEAVKGSEVEA
jgi:hypothetical protein